MMLGYFLILFSFVLSWTDIFFTVACFPCVARIFPCAVVSFSPLVTFPSLPWPPYLKPFGFCPFCRCLLCFSCLFVLPVGFPLWKARFPLCLSESLWRWLLPCFVFRFRVASYSVFLKFACIASNGFLFVRCLLPVCKVWFQCRVRLVLPAVLLFCLLRLRTVPFGLFWLCLHFWLGHLSACCAVPVCLARGLFCLGLLLAALACLFLPFPSCAVLLPEGACFSALYCFATRRFFLWNHLGVLLTYACFACRSGCFIWRRLGFACRFPFACIGFYCVRLSCLCVGSPFCVLTLAFVCAGFPLVCQVVSRYQAGFCVVGWHILRVCFLYCLFVLALLFGFVCWCNVGICTICFGLALRFLLW